MRKFLIAGLIALIPTVALAQHRGQVHRGGEIHRGGGHWHNGLWIPFIVGGAVIGAECWRWVDTPYGPRRYWVC